MPPTPMWMKRKHRLAIYKPVELRPMEDILESLKAFEQEADGMMAEIMENIS